MQKIRYFLFVMQYTHVSGNNGAQSKKTSSLYKTVLGRNYFWKKMKSKSKGGIFFLISTYMGSFVSPG